MNFISLFRDLGKYLLESIPALLQYDQKIRDDIIDVVSDLAAEIGRGLGIYILHLESARREDTMPGAENKIRNLRGELFQSFQKFNVCKGILKLEDKFNRSIPVIAASVDVAKISEIKKFIQNLSNHERLIYEMIAGDIDELISVCSTGDIKKLSEEIDKKTQTAIEKQDRIDYISQDIIRSI